MKLTLIAFLLGVVFIVGAFIFTRSDGEENINNVSSLDGKQIIEIIAKGGYSPRVSRARADLPTVIRMRTRGTFDCSSALVIPSIRYRTILSPSGVAEIDIPPQKKGTTLQGFCGMGMYRFSILFD